MLRLFARAVNGVELSGRRLLDTKMWNAREMRAQLRDRVRPLCPVHRPKPDADLLRI